MSEFVWPLTLGTIDAVPSWLAVFARCAVESFIATTLPAAVRAILTLPVVRAPAADVSRAFEAVVAVKTRAAGMSLQHRAVMSLFSLLHSKKWRRQYIYKKLYINSGWFTGS